MKKYAILIAATLAASVQAATLQLNHNIYSTDNLFYSDWGHWWTQAGDGDNLLVDNNDGALNDGTAARYISYNGSAYGFNRNSILSMTITVSGSVVDNGTQSTDATGNNCYITQTCGFHNGYFHGLPVYSVIGLWSTTADSITPVKYDAFGKAYAAGDAGYDDLSATNTAPFFLGNGGTINFSSFIPDSVETLYLFLAENDGYFSDNNPTEYYTAIINLEIAPQVPVPAAAWMMGSALIGLSAVARRRRIA